jgi:hypothetical protein
VNRTSRFRTLHHQLGLTGVRYQNSMSLLYEKRCHADVNAHMLHASSGQDAQLTSRSHATFCVGVVACWWWFDFRRSDVDSSFPSLPLPSSSLCLCRLHSRAPSHAAQRLHPRARSLEHLRARPSYARKCVALRTHKCVILRGSPGPCSRPRPSRHPQDHPFMRLQIHRLARLQAHHLVRPQTC